MDDTTANLTRLRKRRGVTKASVTRLVTRVRDLEAGERTPDSVATAQRYKEKLIALDAEFRTHHYSIIDLVEEGDEETLATEQASLDDHDDAVTQLTTKLEKIMRTNTPVAGPGNRDIQSRKLVHLEKAVDSTDTEIAAIPLEDSEDTYLLQQYDDRISEFRSDLKATQEELLSLGLEETDALFVSHTRLSKKIFDCGHKIKRLLGQCESTSNRESRGVKLPKLEVPTFDGNVINWTTFWEQFSVSVHSRTNISDPEKLVYLQQAVKGGTAKHAIEGLSRSGDHYNEAVECLRHRYDRPRLIHRTHVKMIVDTPSLKEGSGKELRRLHDKVQQHLRALKAMGSEPHGPFITSVLELKLDENTMFEWQKHSQESTEVPHYNDLLDFLNMRAQASESHSTDQGKKRNEPHHKKPFGGSKSVTSFVGNAASTSDNCVLCKNDKHPLYVCSKFKSLPHEQMVSTVKEHSVCMNCLRAGHYAKQCKSVHHCRKCQKPHHTLLHVDRENPPESQPVTKVSSSMASGISSNTLLMTCRVRVEAPDQSTVEARALLDSGSSASFISERLANLLSLPRSDQGVSISGIAGLTHQAQRRSSTKFTVRSTQPNGKRFEVTALVVPKVTCDLPLNPIPFNSSWKHIENVPLADPHFGEPGRIDILLGVDVYVQALLHGRRIGASNVPVAFETEFGWVLAGNSTGNSKQPATKVATHHAVTHSTDDIIRRFWETEESPSGKTSLTPQEKFVVDHFQDNHSRDETGRFVVPLPRKANAPSLGESRSQAVKRFLTLERSLQYKGKVPEFNEVIQEYFTSEHAEEVPNQDLSKPPSGVFYLPMHIVYKQSSSTTKARVVFDASAKSSSGSSLNDLLLVGPTVHPSLFDVLLRFRLYRVALIADVSRMYRAVQLCEADKDLHRFVWRENSEKPLRDFRMTRVTFGVSASPFAANMAVKQNASDFAVHYPLAAEAVSKSFYVDDGLSGADSVSDAIEMQRQLQNLFDEGGFILRKWNSSEQAVLDDVSPDLIDDQSVRLLTDPQQYTKTLGIQWNSCHDSFRLEVLKPNQEKQMTKRLLVSDIGKIFDVLGWYSPTIIKAKILLQRVWEAKVDWDEVLPQAILDEWFQWRSELPSITEKNIPRCYYPKTAHIQSLQLHGFCDASEVAYSAVVYLRMTDTNGRVHVSLITSKTKVAPIKRLSLPRLELCGANLLAKLLFHVKEPLNTPLEDIYGWTDSTIVLHWLDGNPRRFKTYVGNRIACIMELIPSSHWRHVNGLNNPADCASRGLYPAELLDHTLWWNGPEWLMQSPEHWPQLKQDMTAEVNEDTEVCLSLVVERVEPVLDFNRHSSFTKLKRITAWVLRFVNNSIKSRQKQSSHLTTPELQAAERYWLYVSQCDHFLEEIQTMKNSQTLARSSRLLALHPFLDSSSLLRVGGRQPQSSSCCTSQHPIIVHGKHHIVKLLIFSEHLRLLHAGPQLLTSSLSQRYHIIGHKKTIRSITRSCIICRKNSAKPKPQMLGKLPMERVTPDSVFQKTGLDYAGPLNIKYGHVRKPTIVKAYVCVFVSLTVKAVHLELVSDLSSAAFIACLRRFIARRGLPTLLWSDNGKNVIGASRELEELEQFLEQQKTQGEISDFCSSQLIQWKFIPEHSPNFGGLWEAAVRSFKTHFKRVVGEIKLTFEEATTVLTQIEACMNSRPLVPLPFDDDGVEALTPGHFLIGRALSSLPDESFSYQSLSILKRWHLVQALVRHFWKRWHAEYLASMRKYSKWHYPTKNLQVGDLVTIHEDNLIPGRWPLARVSQVHPGKDGIVRVVTVRTAHGIYK